MNRRSKIVLGATVALMTAVGLHVAAGRHHWHHHGSHCGKGHATQCEKPTHHAHGEGQAPAPSSPQPQ